MGTIGELRGNLAGDIISINCHKLYTKQVQFAFLALAVVLATCRASYLNRGSHGA